MKNIATSILCLLLFCVACDKSQIGKLAVPNESDNLEIHFIQTKLAKEFPQGTENASVSVVLARSGNKGSRTVILAKEGKDADLISFPESVVIPDGKYSVEVPVSVDMSKVIMGSTLKASLSIAGRDGILGNDSGYISQYSDFIDLEFSFTIEWEPLYRTDADGESVQQTASYIYNVFYQGGQTGLPVEKAKGVDNIFRVLDWGGGVPLMFKIDKDNKVTVPAQSIGYFYSDSNEYVYVSDIAQYLGDDSYYSNFPCYFDGEQTLVLNLVYYVKDGIFNYGEERLIFSGSNDFKPIVQAEHIESGRFLFHSNDYTASCRCLIVTGDITRDQQQLDLLYKEICLGENESIVEFSGKGEMTFNVSTGSNTLMAVPFDEEGNPGEYFILRFTHDEDGTILPEIASMTAEPDGFSPYTAFNLVLKTRNTTAIEYCMYDREAMEYFMHSMSYDDILAQIGNTLSEDGIAAANTENGVTIPVSSLPDGSEYLIIAKATNAYGDVAYKTVTVKLKSHSEVFVHKSIEDFTGMFMALADVTTLTQNGNQYGTESYRVDIIRTGDNTVSIKGLCNYFDFSPEVKGTYNELTGCIEIAPQSVGKYKGYEIRFGLSGKLYSTVWQSQYSLQIGFSEDGNLYFRSNPANDTRLTGYKFLIFSGGSYAGGDLANKTYDNISMSRIR